MKNNSIFLIHLVYLLSIGIIFPVSLYSQHNTQFEFRKDHIFKIIQFTDIHWDNKSENCIKTKETIINMLSAEKPDLAILTGDIVTAVPAREGWMSVSAIFSDAKVPWAITLGNHDAEPDITRDGIFELLEPLPYFAGMKGAPLYGSGNHNLSVKSSDGKSIAAVIYCIDSNDYPEDKNLGAYDWIRFDQVGWYRRTSDQYRDSNNGVPIPSLAFFHIPLIEYNNIIGKESTIGEKNELVASSEINSGIFASMVEKKDIMGVFVGHDHDNNYIGICNNICLAYGQVTGTGTYGDFERGARIIELHEGVFNFNTWIRTKSGTKYKYNYPSGLSFDESDVTFFPAIKLKNPSPGIRFNYYEGSFKSTSEINSGPVLKTGLLKTISLSPAEAPDFFALEFNTWLRIPKRAVYRFYTYSDDGSELFIDGKLVVSNDGSHGARRKEGKIALDEGFHEFRLLYFENNKSNVLEVGFASIDIIECRIPDNYFFTEGKKLP